MQVKVIYGSGAINFAQLLWFKHRKFEVVVNISEGELDDSPLSPPVFTSITGNNNHDSADLFLADYKRIRDADMGQLSAWFANILGGSYDMLQMRPEFSLPST